MKKALRILVAAALMLGLAVPALADEPHESGPIVILHTNDVHTGQLERYACVAAYRDRYAQQYGEDRVVLVDAGDAIQGGPIGTLTQGGSIVDIMNFLGYSFATPGNHEFDYGMEEFLDLAQNRASFDYLSSTFMGPDGQPVFHRGAVYDYGDVQVGYIGISTPETLTKSDPTHFQDNSGNYIYSFSEGGDGQNLYDAVQDTVDAAREKGADYVVALAHLGMGSSTPQWSSAALISNTTGIDVLIDGHSHEVYLQEAANLEGEMVPLIQTGTKLANLGVVTLDPATGGVSTQLLPLEGEDVPVDQDALGFIRNITDQFEEQLNQVVGSTSVDLRATEANNWDWAVRARETNLGDLVADAYRWSMGADIGLVNGGGIRADVLAGDITYRDLINVQPYGNELCLMEATGQEVLDALEMGASAYPERSGSFLQVSGLTYTIDPAIPSSVVLSEQGAFLGVEGPYRVTGVQVNGRPLELDQTYTVSSHDYLIKSGGDGLSMFRDNHLLEDGTVLDNQALMSYVTEVLEGQVDEAYGEAGGQNRVTILSDTVRPEPEPEPEPEPTPEPEARPQGRIYTVQAGDSLWRIAARELGSGLRWQEIYDLNRHILDNPDRIYVGQTLKLP